MDVCWLHDMLVQGQIRAEIVNMLDLGNTGWGLDDSGPEWVARSNTIAGC